jgi:hypothetical protein
MDPDFPQILSDASQKYNRLVIVIGLPNTGKTRILNKFKEHPNTVYLNLNLVISEKLLNYSSKEQQYKVEELLLEIIEPYPNKILLFDNNEILFDPNLHINVLNLFKRISRHQICILSWTGSVSDGKLRFGESDYWGSGPSYDLDDIKKIDLNGE